MKTNVLKAMLVAILFGLHPHAAAEDIDLFVGAPVLETDLPNVLLIIDNTGNWNTAFENEKAALTAVFNGLPENKFRVGVMMYGSPDSGYVRAAIRPMNATNKSLYSNFINGLDQVDDRQSARTLGRTMSEAHRYLSGLQSVGGASFAKRDYTGNTSGNITSNAIYALAGNALSSESATTYADPLAGTSCAKTFVVYIGNTLPSGNVTQDNPSRNAAAKSELISAEGDATEIPLSPSGFQGNIADEWARFLKQDMGVVTYTVDVDPTDPVSGHNNGKANSALLKSMAKVSGGKYFAVDSSVGGGSEIADALNTIFSEIQSVNSVFASVSLPVSVNTQGTYLNQVYIGMFRPDAQSLPRWAGNLKQYKLGVVDNNLKLLDAAGSSAINSQTGFITECARSFWTPTSVDGYWSFNPQGACLTVANSDVSNYPDGNIVEKGAQAYLLRSTTPASRVVKTCSPVFASCTSLTDFNTANAAITDTLLGAADATEGDALINWARGSDVDDERFDIYDEVANPDSADLMRPSAHGDVVHSRPVAINYGTDNAPEVVVFYGGNDGVLRAINGNRSAAIGAAAAGSELWSFIPPEFYARIKRIRANSQAIFYPGSTTAGAVPKDYGFDGPITAYADAVNDDYWVYGALRRGGRTIYAFDVSTPATPALKWKLGCPNSNNDTGCSTGFSGIGQTWSSPKVINAAGYASPLLIMGGGYDPCEDIDDPDDAGACTASNKGNKVYLLNADTGALLQTFTTERGVIADITVVPDSNGLASYAYVADLGGNVYRISGANANSAIASTVPGSWTSTKIAALGCDDDEAACTRKFMFAPDVVVDGSTNILLLGSGDREKPIGALHYPNAAGVTNHFFMLKDKPTSATWLSDENATCGADVICRDSLVFIAADAASPAQSVVDLKKGWYLGLAATEQVVTSAITVFGVVTFSTHQPAVAVEGQCSNLGTAKVYNIEYDNAESADGGLRYELISGGGLPPSPVAGMVTLDDGTTVPFIIGASGDSPLEGGEPPPPSSSVQPRAKVYWNIQQ